MTVAGFLIVGVVCGYLTYQFVSRQLTKPNKSERRLLDDLRPLSDEWWSSFERDMAEARAKDRERRNRA